MYCLTYLPFSVPNFLFFCMPVNSLHVAVVKQYNKLFFAFFTLFAADSSQEGIGTMEISRKNKRKMEAKFAKLLMNACKKLKEKQIDFEDFQTFLRSFFPPGECIPRSSNMNEIFEAITRHKLWNYWNYHSLKEIVTVFAADDPDILLWIETYRQDLESYMVTTKLIHHIATVGDSPLEEKQLATADQRYYKKLSCKLKMKFTDQSLKYIDDLWKEVANLYGLPPYVALLHHIQKGCISIVWLIPSHLAPKILSVRVAPPSVDFYRKHAITRVILGDECIYHEEEERHKVPDLATVLLFHSVQNS